MLNLVLEYGCTLYYAGNLFDSPQKANGAILLTKIFAC